MISIQSCKAKGSLYVTYSYVEGFEMKLQLFQKQLAESKLDHFPSCATLKHSKTLKTHFPKDLADIFTILRISKSRFRSKLSDDHPHAGLRIAVSNMTPDLGQLVSEKQAHKSH